MVNSTVLQKWIQTKQPSLWNNSVFIKICYMLQPVRLSSGDAITKHTDGYT